MMIKELNDRGVDNLRIAIVELACHDYMKAKSYRKFEEIESLQKFFRSQWYRELMPKVDGEYLIKKLDEKFEHETMPKLKKDGKACFKRKSAI